MGHSVPKKESPSLSLSLSLSLKKVVSPAIFLMALCPRNWDPGHLLVFHLNHECPKNISP